MGATTGETNEQVRDRATHTREYQRPDHVNSTPIDRYLEADAPPWPRLCPKYDAQPPARTPHAKTMVGIAHDETALPRSEIDQTKTTRRRKSPGGRAIFFRYVLFIPLFAL